MGDSSGIELDPLAAGLVAGQTEFALQVSPYIEIGNKEAKHLMKNNYPIFSILWLGFEMAIIGAIIGNFVRGLEGAFIGGILGGVLGASIGVIVKLRRSD